MADTVIDVITKLSFTADADVVTALNKEFGSQINLVKDLQSRQDTYANKLAKTSADDVRTRQVLTQLIDRQKRKIDEVTIAVGKSFSANEQLNKSVERSKGQFNSLGFALGNIVRDIPYGFIGISNNLGPAFDILTFKMNELRAAGAPTSAIFREIGASVFGLTGILNIAVAAITIFTTNLSRSSKQAEETKVNIDSLTKALDGYNKMFSEVADSEDKGANAIKRTIEAIKAKGVANGEVFASEKQVFEEQQKLREQEISDLERQQKIYTGVADALEKAGQAQASRQRGGNVPTGLLSRQIGNSFDPTDIRNYIRGLPKDIQDAIVKGYEEGTLTARNISESLLKIDEDLKNKRNQLVTDSVEFDSKKREEAYNLQVQLSDKIFSLNQEYSKLQIQDQIESTDKIKELVQNEVDSNIRELNKQIEETRKRGILTSEIEGSFSQIRVQIQQTANLEILQKQGEFLKELYNQQLSYYDNIDKLRVDNAKGSLAQLTASGQDTLELRQKIAGLETKAELNEILSKYKNLFEVANKSGADIAQLEEEKQKAIEDVQFRGERRQIQALDDYFKDRQIIISRNLDIESNEIQSDVGDTIEALQQKYDSGLINYNRYFKKRKTIQDRANLDALKAARQAAEQELQAAINNQELVRANPNATGIDRQNAGNRVNIAQNNVTKAADAVINAEGAISKARQEQIFKAISEYQQLAEAAVSAYNTIAEAQQQQLDNEIRIRERRVEQATKLAEKGNVEVLKIEQDRLDEAYAKQEENARRTAFLNNLLTTSYAILAVARAAAEGGVFAPATVAAAIAALIAGYSTVRSLSVETGFKEGGYTGEGNTNDEAGVVHKKEFVIPADKTAMYRPQLEQMLNGTFNPVVNTIQTYNNNSDFKVLSDKMDGVIEAIGYTETKVNARVDGNGVAIMTERYRKFQNKRFR